MGIGENTAFDLIVAALVWHVFLFQLFFGAMILTRMQWSAQLVVTKTNEDLVFVVFPFS